MGAERGMQVSLETVRRWNQKFGPELQTGKRTVLLNEPALEFPFHRMATARLSTVYHSPSGTPMP